MMKKMNLYLYNKDKNPEINQLITGIMVSERDYDDLGLDINSNYGLMYVKVESKDPVKRYTIYGRLNLLPKNKGKDGDIWIPELFKTAGLNMYDGNEVDVEIINHKELAFAEAVTIKLDEESVKLWAEEEVQNASNYLKGQEELLYVGQKIYMRPGTKDVVVGEITNIYPNEKETIFQPKQINSSTNIVFEGLPDDLQKSIDFDKIGGLEHLIKQLREIILLPLNYPQIFEKFDIVPPKGMLLYGPPGNGKTMLARLVAKSLGAHFITVQGPEFLSKYVGSAEQEWRRVFNEAQSKSHCVIFIDEIDSIVSIREKAESGHEVSIVSTLLNEMDGIKKNSNVFVIGATNRINAIDPAMRRPGRFDLEFEVPLPDYEARLDILSKNIPIKEDDKYYSNVDESFLKLISELTNGFSGADLIALKREATMSAVRKQLHFDTDGKMSLSIDVNDIKVDSEDFHTALKHVKPSALRGLEIDSYKRNVHWDNILGLDHIKKELEAIKYEIDKKIANESLQSRINLLNLIFKGERGAGKKTVISAFAKKFNFEVLMLDMLSLSFSSQQDAFQSISNAFQKSKQISPSIVYIRNLDKLDSSHSFVNVILNTMDCLSVRHYVFVIIEIEQEGKLPESLFGYRAFSKIMDFSNVDKVALINTWIKDVKPDVSNGELSNIIENYKNEPIGKILTELNEKYNN
ncbi:MAG: AAA family ATPase [Bacteroidales bacterium]|jgi:SpoVK/Ycf46/Vps4 family AAA+-type ATPase